MLVINPSVKYTKNKVLSTPYSSGTLESSPHLVPFLFAS